MKYRIAAVLGVLVLLGAYGLSQLQSTPLASVPNVVLIVVDDFGIDASPCYPIGAEKPVMPNLERLCAEGVVFDNVWVNPLCTPTRAALMTGQYGFRTGVRQNRQVLAPDTTTLFDVLSSNVPTPYRNAVVGKWHVSGPQPSRGAPAAYGVHHFAGFLSGALESYHAWEIIENGEPRQARTYSTTLLTDKAIEWVGEQEEPWFLWLAYNAPHWPFHLPPRELLPGQPELSGRQTEIDEDPRPYFLAMAEALDHEIGRFLASIDAATRENTTVILIGDNGTDPDVIQAPFAEDRAKTSPYEGGIRVPLVVAGRSVARHGDREDALINGVDVPATIAQLAGYRHGSFGDGVSFLGALSDSSSRGREFIYTDGPFRTRSGRQPGWAIRDVRYKLIHYDSGDRKLFDLLGDPWEEHDLLEASDDPALQRVVASLERLRDALVGTQPASASP